MSEYVSILIGVGLIEAGVLAWAGRWRRWSRQFITSHLPLPITLFPAFGFMLIAVGVAEVGWPGLSSSSPLIVISLLVLGLAVILALWNPAWWGPSWYRAEKSSGNQNEPDLTDPLTGVVHAAVADAGRSQAEVAGRFGDQQPLARWNATLISGTSEESRPHAFASAQNVGGKLELYPSGLAFSAHGQEDRMREKPITVSVFRNELRGVRVASPEEMESPGTGKVSILPHLIVEAVDATHAFKVFFARSKARTIERVLIERSRTIEGVGDGRE